MKQAKKKKGKMLSLPSPSFKKSAPTTPPSMMRRREPQPRQQLLESEEVLDEVDSHNEDEDENSDVDDPVLNAIVGDPFGGVDLSIMSDAGGTALEMPMLPAQASDDDADLSLQSSDYSDDEEEVMPTDDAREVELVPFRDDNAMTDSLEAGGDLPQGLYLVDIEQENISQPLNFQPRAKRSAMLSFGRACAATATAASRQGHRAMLVRKAPPTPLAS